MAKSSIYKGVYFQPGRRTFKGYWLANHKEGSHTKWSIRCDTERDAAIAYDKKMISLGKEPVNILKRK